MTLKLVEDGPADGPVGVPGEVEDEQPIRLHEKDDFDLSHLNTLHMLHALEVEVGDLGSTVRMGFKWAEVGLGAGLGLCVCVAKCENPSICGRVFYSRMEELEDPRLAQGNLVQLRMPWKKRKKDLELGIWCCGNCNIVGTAGVFDYWVGRFAELPARLLQWEHEKSSREYSGLVESMKRAYGDQFSESAFVTLVLYRRAS